MYPQQVLVAGNHYSFLGVTAVYPLFSWTKPDVLIIPLRTKAVQETREWRQYGGGRSPPGATYLCRNLLMVRWIRLDVDGCFFFVSTCFNNPTD